MLLGADCFGNQNDAIILCVGFPDWLDPRNYRVYEVDDFIVLGLGVGGAGRRGRGKKRGGRRCVHHGDEAERKRGWGEEQGAQVQRSILAMCL